LFAKGPGESLLVDAGIAPASEEFRPAWEARLLPLFSASDLQTPAEAVPASRSEHTQHLKTLLADLQSVARLDPQAGW
jgi:ring-1,2-phenylacetyl-CoA epoxidase subunit PaaC